MGGSSSYLLHADAAGTTTMVTDQTGAATGDATFYPWGQVWQISGGSDGTFGDLGFEVNYPLPPSETRDYNPTLVRWMTPDPAGQKAVNLANPQTWNMYAYVADNPTTLNDPSGLLPPGPPGAGDGDGCSAQNAPGDCPKAQQTNSTAPSKFVVEPKKTENHGYYSIFHYQLETKNDTPLKGKGYSVEEHVSGHLPKGSITTNGEFKPMSPTGEATDKVGFVRPPPPGSNGHEVQYQRFTVRFNGEDYPLTTVFKHEELDVDGVVTVSVTDVVP